METLKNLPNPRKPYPEMPFGDVPLERALISWNWPPPHGDSRVVVIPHPDDNGKLDRLELTCTTGACWAGWEKLSKKERVNKLLHHAMELSLFDKVPIEAVHEAFWVIPEYRELYKGDERIEHLENES